MSLITSEVSKAPSGTVYPRLSEGQHSLTLIDVRDMHMRETAYGPKHKILFKWIGEEFDGEGNPISIVRVINWTMGSEDKVSGLKRLVDSIVGRKLTLDEARHLDLSSLIGSKNVGIVEHDGVYANLTTIMKPTTAKAEAKSDNVSTMFGV